MQHKKSYILYISIIMLVLLIPFAGMAFQSQDASTELQESNPWPDIVLEDGTLNVAFLSGMGDYFQHHFALRKHMVTANSVLKDITVKSGSQDQVIIGKDGWLFYEGTINDYLGRKLLSDRELYSVAHNISLIQEYAEQNGSRFLFTVSPNKNSLYGKYMPYNYIRGAESNIQNLKPLMIEAGIAYADLFEAFEREEEELYFKRDSHWNNKGAALAYNTIMDALEKPHESYRDISWEARTDHTGDLNEMLYLLPRPQEMQYYPNKDNGYIYVNDIENHMDAWIETANEEKTGCLLMYRDSFGESLVPFFADEFEEAYFTRLVPYDLTDVEYYQPDYVVIQKAERNLIDFIARAAIVPGQEIDNMNPAATIETSSTIRTDTDGDYLVIRGEVDLQYIQAESDIFVSVYSVETGQTKTYKMMYLTNEQRTGDGYCLYLDKESLPGELQIQLIISDNNSSEFIVQYDSIINESYEEESS